MREHDLQPKRRRRYVATTDSDHDNPIFPNRARGMSVDGANQLWVADLTYIARWSNRSPEHVHGQGRTPLRSVLQN